MDDTTELALPEVEEVEVQDELDEGATDYMDSDNPDEGPDELDEDTVEVEKDGIKFKVPAALKDEIMLRADYTRKTQELAEQRKALDAKITEVDQAGEDEINVRASLVAVNAAIQQYQGVDWDLLEQQDPSAAQRHFRTFMQLQNQQNELANDLRGAEQRRTTESQRLAAERIQQGLAELQRDIPDWGADKARALLDFGEKQFGFDRKYMESVDDPRLIKLLNAVYVAMKPDARKQPQAAVSQPRPASRVRGGSAPRKALDDRMSAEDWVKQRNAQLAKR